MRRMMIGAVVTALVATVAVGPRADAAPSSVVFPVDSLHEPLTQRDIHGTLHEAPCAAGTVVLLQHGLSYTRRAWDRPGYSVVEPLLASGFDVVTCLLYTSPSPRD